MSKKSKEITKLKISVAVLAVVIVFILITPSFRTRVFDSLSAIYAGENLAAAFTAGWNILSSWWFWILLILLAIYLVWRFVFKKK